jgi:cytochrome P450
MTPYRNVFFHTSSVMSPAVAGLRRVAGTASLLAFIASPSLRRSPYRAYGLMRRVDPVHRSPLGAWVLTRHADVAAALKNPALGSDESKADPTALRLGLLNRVLSNGRTTQLRGPFLELARRLLIFRDPPDHTRIRALVSKAFTTRRVEGLAPSVVDLVDELLEPALGRGRIELMSEVAYPLPLRVICGLLGVPAGDEKILLDNAPALAVGLDPDPMRSPEAVAAADRATETLVGYLEDLIGRRRRQRPALRTDRRRGQG